MHLPVCPWCLQRGSSRMLVLETELADSPSVPANFAFLAPLLRPSRRSPFLPQSRSLRCQGPTPSQVVGGAKREHAAEKAVELERCFPLRRKAKDEDLAVTRSRAPL